MNLNGCFRNNSSDKAELFNRYFSEQFSSPSNYNIDIDWSNDASFNIDFSHQKIRKLLQKIKSNKACGPDEIHGKILQNCTVSIAYPREKKQACYIINDGKSERRYVQQAADICTKKI